MFNAAVARIGLFCFILWCQGYTPGPCVLSAFPPDLYSQCLTLSLVLFCLLLFSCLPRRLLFCLTSCLLLNPFSAFVVSVSCSVLSGWFAGMLCWYFCGWLIVPGISIACHHCHWSPTDPLLYCCSASYAQLLQWSSFPHFPESSLVSGCLCFWWKPYSGSSWVLTQGSLLSGCFSRQS